MTKQIALSLPFTLLLVTQAHAQSAALPQTYSFTAASEAFGPMTVRVNRNGSKELLETATVSGNVHMRQLYDFNARRVYTVDLGTNRCTTQEYVSPCAPPMHDPIGGAGEMAREAARLRTVGRENVSGIATRLVEAPLEGNSGKSRLWLEEKFGFPVKQTIQMARQPERLMFEIKQLSYSASPENLFAAPSNCTRIAGVTNANGGSAQMTVDVRATGEASAAPAPTAVAAPVGADPVTGKWQFTGKDGGGVQWSGDLTITKLEGQSFDRSKYSHECELGIASADSGRGVSGPCLYDASSRTISISGGAGSSKYSLAATLSPDGTGLAQGKWVEGNASGSWSAVRTGNANSKD